MNGMRYAIYVEGLSELLFVADVLQKYFNYDATRCGIRCITINAERSERLSYPQLGDENSACYYQIVNVNNDNKVISKLNKDLPGLIAQGYSVIIGLKDAYGRAYEQIMGGRKIVDTSKVEELHANQAASLNTQGHDCRLHFAVMEYEAWMLALIENFVVSKGKSIKELSALLALDLACDLEQVVYHPYSQVQKIYELCGESYHKHQKETMSFLDTLSIREYEQLRQSGRCASFAKFMNSLLGEKFLGDLSI